MSISLHQSSDLQGPSTSIVSCDAAAHAQAWAALAHLIAGSPVMRFATRAGKYPRPNGVPPRITQTLPSRAAAVMVHGPDRKVSTLCLDLDTSKARQGIVDADAIAIGSLLDSCGLLYVADHSPSGGRHIYVPLAERMSAENARELVEALATRFPSLDPGPHQNVTDGCIRPPGSWHKSMTGHQVLDTPLEQATSTMVLRNAAPMVAALSRKLAASIHQVRARSARKIETLSSASSSTPSPALANDTLYRSVLRSVARTGIYDSTRYKSDSEARMAVLTHLANFPLSLPDVQGRLMTDFSGLRSLYTNQDRIGHLLPFEWSKAKAFVAKKTNNQKQGVASSLKYDTKPSLTHGGGTQDLRSTTSVMAEINDIENVLYSVLDQRLIRVGREGITLRLLLRAVIGFARAKESLVIDVGCRSFAIAMGKHHGTIARLLPRLEGLTDGLIERVERGHGKNADAYQLRVPQHWESIANALSWRKGKIYGIRPVFRALGDVAALVYEGIERAKTTLTTAEIVRVTGIGRTAVDQALLTMAELAMVERRHEKWQVLQATNLTNLAEWLGVQDEYEAHKRRVRAERRAWHAHLERFQCPPIREEDLYYPEQSEWDPWNPHVWDEVEQFKRLLLVS